MNDKKNKINTMDGASLPSYQEKGASLKVSVEPKRTSPPPPSKQTE